jgi:rare lipoprotein A
MASWYGRGRMTASGERFDKHAMTAAHRTLPFGTRARVTNKRNGRSVIVRINDRGPFARGRIIDVSEGAAGQLGMKRDGVVPVKVERLR